MSSHVYVEMRYWPEKRGIFRPTILVTPEALEEYLLQQTSILDPDDARELIRGLLQVASENECSEQEALTRALDRMDEEDDVEREE